MNSYQRDVHDFHVAMEMPTGDYAAPKVARPGLRISLIREEGNELLAGLESRDLVETIDGAIDLAYVTYGAAVEFGVDLRDDCRCDMFPETRPPSFRHNNTARWLAAAIEEVCEAIEEDDRRRMFVFDANSVIDVCHRIVADCGVYWRPMWDEVQRSNMSKVGGPKRADGKMLKGPNYSPPDIRGILVRFGASL